MAKATAVPAVLTGTPGKTIPQLNELLATKAITTAQFKTYLAARVATNGLTSRSGRKAQNAIDALSPAPKAKAVVAGAPAVAETALGFAPAVAAPVVVKTPRTPRPRKNVAANNAFKKAASAHEGSSGHVRAGILAFKANKEAAAARAAKAVKA